MNLETRQAIEKRIYSRIVKDALNAGFNVSVYDGEEYALEHSTSYKAIMDAGFSTDQDALIIYRDDKRIGFVSLIYGNSGWDVISDYTASDDMEKLLSGADALADQLEGACV
jgi:hypothetical protein